MDSVGYIVLCALFAAAFFALIIADRKIGKTVPMLIAAVVCWCVSAVLFVLYLHDRYWLPVTGEGIAVTGVMRLFMLDDNVFSDGGIGLITSSSLLVANTAFAVYWLQRHLRAEKH